MGVGSISDCPKFVFKQPVINAIMTLQIGALSGGGGGGESCLLVKNFILEYSMT